MSDGNTRIIGQVTPKHEGDKVVIRDPSGWEVSAEGVGSLILQMYATEPPVTVGDIVLEPVVTVHHVTPEELERLRAAVTAGSS